MARTIAPQIIDIVKPTTGLRGKIERLFHEYNTKAQALRITAEILDEEDRRIAVVDAPKKFLHAINHRNGHAGRPPLEKTTKVKKLKPPIHGKTLTLFLLEHLDETPRPAQYFRDKLAAAGSIMHGDIRIMNGPLGSVCAKRGWAKRSEDGYRITAKGTAHAARLREQLEIDGKVKAGGYTAG